MNANKYTNDESLYTNLMRPNDSYRQPMRPSYSPQHSYAPHTGRTSHYNGMPYLPSDGAFTARNSMTTYNYRNQEPGPDCYQPAAVAAKLSATPSPEEVGIEMILSPIFLRGHSMLKDCDLSPNVFDAFEKRLRSKLEILKEGHRSFKVNMEEQIRKAEAKHQSVQAMLNDKQQIANKNERSKSADILTKKQIKFPQEQDAEREGKIETPKPVAKRRSRKSVAPQK